MAGKAEPQHLVSTAWLAVRLEDPALRIYDCAMQEWAVDEKLPMEAG